MLRAQLLPKCRPDLERARDQSRADDAGQGDQFPHQHDQTPEQQPKPHMTQVLPEVPPEAALARSRPNFANVHPTTLPQTTPLCVSTPDRVASRSRQSKTDYDREIMVRRKVGRVSCP